MALPSNEEFFGSVLPSPSISKITLQLSGNPPRRLNPHLDQGHRPNSEFIPEETSTLGVTEGSERTSNPSNLNVLLNVTIKELARNLQNSWLSTLNNLQSTQGNSAPPLDLAEYVKIKVLQNTDTGLTEQILNSVSTSIDPLDSLLDASGGVKAEHAAKLDLKEKSLSDIVGDPTKSSVSIANQPAFFNIPYSLSFELLRKNPSYLCYFCWAELDLLALAARFNFDAQSLGISATRSKIKHQVVIRGGNTVKFVDVFKTPSGKIWEGDIRDEENNVAWAGEWTSPTARQRLHPMWWGEWTKSNGSRFQSTSPAGYHQMPDGTFMTDGVHRAQSEPIEKVLVTRERVSDIKIQDFRTSEKIDKLSLDFSILENKLKKDLPLAAKMRTANVSLESPVKYFSDISLTRDMSNNCRFLFSVDIASIMQNNSMFGNLFVKPTTKSECVTNTKILSMKLHRVRVKGSPEAGSSVLRGPSGKPKKFSEPSDLHGTVLTVQGQNSPVNNYTTDGDDLILEASYNNVGDLVSISRDGQGSVIQEEIGINPTAGQEYIKFFSGTDMSVKHKTDGYYQYRLVLELEDGAVQYLVDSINQLNEAKLKLTEYYSQASKLGSSQIKTARTNPHIQQAYSQPANVQKPGFFDPATNRFTEEFRGFATTQRHGPIIDGTQTFTPSWYADLPLDPPWKTVAQTYVNIIFKLGDYENASYTEETNLIDSLTNYMSPETGNIEGILKVFQLIDTLQNILSKEIGASTSAPDGLSSKPANQNQNKRLTLSGKTVMAAPLETKDSTIPVTRVDYTFSNVFNSNLPKNVGIQVFPLGNLQTLPSSGFRKIRKSEFETYVYNEKAKIFNIQPNTTILLNFKVGNTTQTYGVTDVDYTYFTPSILKTEQQTIDLSNNAGSATEQAFGATQVIDSFGVSPETRKKSIDLASLLTDYVADNYDLIVVPKIEPLPATSFQAGPATSLFIVNWQDLYNNSRSKAKQNEQDSYGTFVKFLNTFKGKIKTDIGLYNPSNPLGYIIQANNNILEVQKLPNQTKALFAYYADFQPGAQLSPGGEAIFADNITKIFTNGAFRGDENTKSAMRYLFETIFILEYFTGYELDSENKILVEKWEPLSRNNIGITNSDRLLCRLRRYENEKYGITVDRSSQLPLYEEYFIMEL